MAIALTLTEQAGLRKEQKQQQLEKGFETQVRVLEGRIDERAHQYQQQSLVASSPPIYAAGCLV